MKIDFSEEILEK